MTIVTVNNKVLISLLLTGREAGSLLGSLEHLIEGLKARGSGDPEIEELREVLESIERKIKTSDNDLRGV
jgi:hypothetical protein